MSVRSRTIRAPLSGCPSGPFTSPCNVVVWAQALAATKREKAPKSSERRNPANINFVSPNRDFSLSILHRWTRKRLGYVSYYLGKIAGFFPYSRWNGMRRNSFEGRSISLVGIEVFKVVALFSLSCALAVSAAQPPPGNLSKAEDLYKQTSYEASLALLDKSSNDAATNFLLGRDYFMLGEYKNAADALQKATSERPANSDYMDWLGRTYGKRAETANPLLAPSFALKARQAFEQAVQLN